MSPSESDLRAALHDGAGGDLNVEHLIVHARARVAQRRTRITSTIAIAAVVAGLGVGGGLLVSRGGDTSATSNADAGGGLALDRSADNAYGAKASGTAGGAVVAPGVEQSGQRACPASAPTFDIARVATAAGPLFTKPVTTIVVCAYGAPSTKTTSGSPALELTGNQARRFTSSLDRAATTTEGPTVPSAYSCSDHQTRSTAQPLRTFAVVGITAHGRPAGVLSVQFQDQCSATVTNGTAARYQWAPADAVRTRMFALTPR